jgi:ketosteroid isomerase-like protein
MLDSEIHALADRMFAAIEAGDTDAVAACYADDAVIWQNTDQVEQGKADNLRVLSWLVGHTALRSYRDVRRTVIDHGFVQQHSLHVGFDDGRTADLPACVVVAVADGLIVRIDEYLDGAAVAITFGRQQ